MSLNRETLAKMLQLTTSGTDGEVLTAFRKANEMLKREGLTWYDVLPYGVPKPAPAGKSTMPPPSGSAVQRRGVTGKESMEEISVVAMDLLNEMTYNFARGLRGLPPRRKR